MKKQTIINGLFFVLLIALFVSFSSCGKDSMYNPKQKISKIYEEFSYSGKTFKELTQEWYWEKDKLSKIDFWASNFYWIEGEAYLGESVIYNTDRYFYENNKLVKIEQENGRYSLVTYDGSNYKTVESFNSSNERWLTMKFSYNNKKISAITLEMIENYYDKTSKMKLLSSFLPKEFVAKITNNLGKSLGKKGQYITTIDVNYTYTGNNIQKMIVDIIEDGDPYKFTVNYLSYDNKSNPFYKKNNLNYDFFEEYVYGNMIVTPENNPLEIKYVYSVEGEGQTYSITENYHYSYTYNNKNFPIETILTVSSDDGDSGIFKTYYVYK